MVRMERFEFSGLRRLGERDDLCSLIFIWVLAGVTVPSNGILNGVSHLGV